LDTSILGVGGDSRHGPDRQDHPVLNVIHTRYYEGSKPGQRTDGYKVGLAIEGGGMRGAVSAGAAAAVHLLGLHDAVDVVYGSSAGALVRDMA
jgi:predicted acylesterase/phospholipase RssA